MFFKRKPSLVFLNNQAYHVRVPSGAPSEERPVSDWDCILAHLEDTEQLNWRYIWSWCQEAVGSDDPDRTLSEKLSPPDHRLVRGCVRSNSSSVAHVNARGSHLGFRPILEPVNPETLEPDLDRWADLPDGESIPLCSLYIDDVPIYIPQAPTDEGDIPDYTPGSRIHLGWMDGDPAKHVHMIKCGPIFVADRNLLKNVSWDDLNRNGLIFGNKSKIRPRRPSRKAAQKSRKEKEQ